MTLSAAFNFFDGGELLPHSVAAIRPYVDHLSIVTQDLSNFGHPQSSRSKIALDELAGSHMVDIFETYEPDLSLGGGRNEFAKRHIGWELALAAGCDSVIFMDVDEFYVGHEFSLARKIFEESGYHSSTVRFHNYYQRPTLRTREPVGYVPFICRLSEHHEYGVERPYPVDLTRAVASNANAHHLFPPTEIVMHHMTGVRHDLQEKLVNSSQNDDPAGMVLLRKKFSMIPDLTRDSAFAVEGTIVHFEEVPDIFNLDPTSAR